MKKSDAKKLIELQVCITFLLDEFLLAIGPHAGRKARADRHAGKASCASRKPPCRLSLRSGQVSMSMASSHPPWPPF
jgi:hypothetical protein